MKLIDDYAERDDILDSLTQRIEATKNAESFSRIALELLLLKYGEFTFRVDSEEIKALVGDRTHLLISQNSDYDVTLRMATTAESEANWIKEAATAEYSGRSPRMAWTSTAERAPEAASDPATVTDEEPAQATV